MSQTPSQSLSSTSASFLLPTSPCTSTLPPPAAALPPLPRPLPPAPDQQHQAPDQHQTSSRSSSSCSSRSSSCISSTSTSSGCTTSSSAAAPADAAPKAAAAPAPQAAAPPDPGPFDRGHPALIAPRLGSSKKKVNAYLRFSTLLTPEEPEKVSVAQISSLFEQAAPFLFLQQTKLISRYRAGALSSNHT